MAVYEILQKVIADKNLSIADAARLCNLPDSTVRGIIRRKQNTVALDVAFKLSDGLGVSLEFLNGLPEHKKAPAPAEADTGAISLDESNALLVALGYIKPGDEITDEDLAFLDHIVGLLDTWFDTH